MSSTDRLVSKFFKVEINVARGKMGGNNTVRDSDKAMQQVDQSCLRYKPAIHSWIIEECIINARKHSYR